MSEGRRQVGPGAAAGNCLRRTQAISAVLRFPERAGGGGETRQAGAGPQGRSLGSSPPSIERIPSSNMDNSHPVVAYIGQACVPSPFGARAPQADPPPRSLPLS